MFRNITETAGTISLADYLSAMDLSSKVALFNVNYRRPYWVVTLAEASLLSCSAARVTGSRSRNHLQNLTGCSWSQGASHPKISWKFVYNFLSNPTDRKRSRDKLIGTTIFRGLQNFEPRKGNLGFPQKLSNLSISRNILENKCIYLAVKHQQVA